MEFTSIKSIKDMVKTVLINVKSSDIYRLLYVH